MFEILHDLNEFLRDKELNETVSIKWQTHEQQMYEMNQHNNLVRARAINRYETEKDPEVKRKIGILMNSPRPCKYYGRGIQKACLGFCLDSRGSYLFPTSP